MPEIGLGTWLSPKNAVYKAVKYAIMHANYRHIDCASIYFNESEVGQALTEVFQESTVSRNELFITSKLWNDYHKYDDVIEACKATLQDLNLEYLDLYLIHFPVSFKKGVKEATSLSQMETVSLKETWSAMEELVRLGLVRNIGVSNFAISDIQEVLKHNKLPIAVNQFECHPYLQLKELRSFCAEHKIVVTAHTSLGSPGNPWSDIHPPKLMEDPLVMKLALQYNKSPANILCRWALQNNLIALPKSITESRIKENLYQLSFVIKEDDLRLLNNLDMGEKGRFNHPVTPWLKRGPFPDDIKRTLSNYSKFDGLFCAALTPFTSESFQKSINYKLIDDYAAHFVYLGIKGVLVGGTTGEGYSLTCEERMNLLDKWCNTSAVRNGHLQVIAMVSASSHMETIKLAQQAVSLHVRALMIMGHSFWNHYSSSDFVDYLADISQATNYYPLIYYHYPNKNHVNLNPLDVFKKAKLKVPNLVGIKYTHSNLDEIGKLSSDYPHCDLFCGGDSFGLYAWTVGFNSNIGTGYHFVGRTAVKMYESYKRGDMSTALECHQVVKSMDAYLNNSESALGGGHGNYKLVLMKELMKQLFNMDFGGCRLPVRPIDQRSKTKIANDKSMLLSWFNQTAKL